MPRIFRSDSALLSRISISFLSSMICFLTSSRRWATACRLASWISLVRSSQSVRFWTESTSLSNSLLSLQQLFAGLVLGLLGFLGELLVKRFDLCLDHVEPAVHGPLSSAGRQTTRRRPGRPRS